MSSSESDSKDVTEDSDEGQIYQLIYDMIIRDDKEEEKDEVQIPSSCENTPVHLKTDAEWSAHASAVCSNRPFSNGSEDEATHNTTHTRQMDQEAGNPKGLDTLDNIPGIPVPTASEDKPWRKAGADISDYFNFGFDEESWNIYSKKQSKIRKANRKLYTKIMGQKEKEASPAPPPSGTPSTVLTSRQPNATNNANKGRRRSRVRRRRRLSDGEKHSQVTTERSPKEDRFTSYPSSPSNFNTLFAYVPPPPFLFQPGPLSASLLAALDGGSSKGFDDPSTSGQPCSSGVSSLIPRSTSSKAGGIDTATECYKRKEKRDKDRYKSREHGRYEDITRGRNRDRVSCSSSHSAEERTRHRDTTEQGHGRHSLGEKEERHGERRHRDDSEGWQKSSRSSSRSRRARGEDRDSQSRHKHRKAKRNRKDKETKMSSADQDRKFK
ncbi:pre-mRNA 3'-end-processing factor FIP1 isoform X2 [Etheostoma cragini]|uniref:pre-mRNA 3'-end-processing factor FIP1 isoform X2 n=1 Tax=Etheostoma cragini TaxID=417921 RepID=UPI00155F4FE6|nr:pre-mRNA 3'-end-processing factor FIP1 isoform X2 [Etheostoma cragini]